jgi:hypothetical protein
MPIQRAELLDVEQFVADAAPNRTTIVSATDQRSWVRIYTARSV